MQDWYMLNLGDPLLAEAALQQIKQHFQSEFSKSPRREDMAIFFRHESEGRLHCELKLYFTPAAGAVANRLHASTCAQPAADDLGLLAGTDAARSNCFKPPDL